MAEQTTLERAREIIQEHRERKAAALAEPDELIVDDSDFDDPADDDLDLNTPDPDGDQTDDDQG